MSHYSFASLPSLTYDPLLFSFSDDFEDLNDYPAGPNSQPSHSSHVEQDAFKSQEDCMDLMREEYWQTQYEVEAPSSKDDHHSSDLSDDEVSDEDDEEDINLEFSDTEQTVDRGVSQELSDEQWEQLSSTEKRICMEFSAADLECRGSQENLFTHINDEWEFDLVAPFGEKPFFATISFPVEDAMLTRLRRQLPFLGGLWKLRRTREGFNEFAQEWEFKGNEERRRVLKRLAKIRTGQEDKMLGLWKEEPLTSPDSDTVESSDDRRRHRRALRIAATAEEGATPTGRKLEKRPIRLFEEEERVKRGVRRRRLELEDY